VNLRPSDHRGDAAKDLAPELADIAAQIAMLKGEANTWLRDPNYGTLRHRVDNGHTTVEGAAAEVWRRVRLNEGRER
jgi:hypothetical protein